MIPPFGTVAAGVLARQSAIGAVKLRRAAAEDEKRFMRSLFDRIGPRHRMANRWSDDLGWTWNDAVMRGWLDGEVPEIAISMKAGHG